MAAEARVEVITREGCHLCDDALDVVAEVCGRLGLSYGVTDVDAPAAAPLLAEFGWDVPVVRVDGRVLSVHRVAPEVLERALVAAPGTWRPW